MKTLLLLSVLLCAAFSAPAEEQKPLEAALDVQTLETAAEPEAALDVQAEQTDAEPEAALDVQAEESAPEQAHFSVCPAGWSTFESRCYKLIHSSKSWFDAEEYCNELGAHLASVTNPRQKNYLHDLAQAESQTYAWLGGFYLQSEWMWIDRNYFYYTNWYSQLTASSNPCIYLHANLGWRNSACSTARPFICSKNPYGC
ncbi:snaclec coagulation factor IX-binding protein subunit A-like isoform X1 [Cyprinodon tularosa]|uniref:snaclec coagulation factor IX-binding protein subunit A-like isoform X1 n=1 Tax=Cyprinodon tularosa TaxID=77115 RepID=UPI0018E27EE2|nr:snaclec coagulation factor IX-binding protein subunit A-like isoform X1 [Cyprinodon tularosa]